MPPQLTTCYLPILIVSVIFLLPEPVSTFAVTFLTVKLRSCDVIWKAGNAALHAALPSGLKLDHNDLGGHRYRKLTTIRLPDISAKTYLRELDDRVWLEAGSVTSDLFLDIYSCPADWQKAAEMQAIFVEEQDKETGRAAGMFSVLRHTATPEGTCLNCSDLCVGAN